MDYRTIRVEERAGIAQITLARPEVMNALSSRMREELLHAVTDTAPRARVLVLTGEGRGFCSGQDLGDARGLGIPDFERILREEYEPLLRAIADCPVPTLAAVNGVAAGAGANLALACDVVIAAESARFIQAFTRIGLIPDAGGTWTLPRQIGLARAMGAALFADAIPATEAAGWGMIYEAVPDETFEAHWQARATHLAEGPTRAYGALKQALRASFGNGFEEQLALEARLQGACGASADFLEGVTAFLEKRPARFTGR
ncbi:enoyl-CoA hydratase-related protein [Cereibacter sediminicola]|uniref:enoyl-CoA hydratase-related protein n=1 Tax=Cereibacter sediminicola TaxID=2584941 RepID=UPI0011A8734C|nr:enoyl-CoA hydratase-related protein [Cereibacter sediminicola]